MRRADPQQRSDVPRRGRSARLVRRVRLRTLVALCAVLCGLLLAVAYGAAALGDAFEPRVSLVTAAGGFDAFATAAGTPSATLSLALEARPAARNAQLRTPLALRDNAAP